MKKLELVNNHLVQGGKPTAFAQQLLGYFAYRADVLNNTVQHQLMDAATAKAMYERLLTVQKYKIAATMNKQKGEKKQVAYLTAMVNMLIEANSDGITYNHDPRELTTVTKDGMPLRTLSRRVDGAFPTAVRARIIDRANDALTHVNRQGLSNFRLLPGSIGNAARAMGGASLPLLANFTQDREVLFKDNA